MAANSVCATSAKSYSEVGGTYKFDRTDPKMRDQRPHEIPHFLALDLHQQLFHNVSLDFAGSRALCLRDRDELGVELVRG